MIPAHTIGFLQNQWILIMPYGPCRFRHPKHLFDVFSVGQIRHVDASITFSPVGKRISFSSICIWYWIPLNTQIGPQNLEPFVCTVFECIWYWVQWICKQKIQETTSYVMPRKHHVFLNRSIGYNLYIWFCWFYHSYIISPFMLYIPYL